MGREDGGRATVRRMAMPLLGVGVAIALLAMGCSRESAGANDPSTAGTAGVGTVVPQDEGKPQDGGQLVFGVEAEPDGLDPTSSQFANAGHLIASSMLEPLALFDEHKVAQPYLASAITPNATADRWTITVKPNITFHDGAPLDAAAVAANLEAQRQGIGTITLKPIESVAAVDASTVEVKMNQPWASFPSMLAGQIGYQMSPATLHNPDAASHPVGTGPFVFDHWDRGTAIGTKKNPGYWQPGEPHLDRLEFRVITDPDTRANGLASGDLDMITTDKAQTITNYKANPDFTVIVDATGDAKDVTLNEAMAPFDDVNARRAVILATDSAALADSLGEGVLEPIDQPFADGSAYHQPDAHYPKYDLEAAKQAVAQYTAATGKPLEFTFTTYADTSNLTTAQILQEQWSKAGMKVDIVSKDPTELIKSVITGQTQAAIEGNFGYPDPDFNYIFWHSSFTAPVGQLSINFPHTTLPAVDQALADGRASVDPQKRQEAYKAVVRQLNDNATYVWLYRYVAALIAADKVHGLQQAEAAGFTSISAKGWYGDLWIAHP